MAKNTISISITGTQIERCEEIMDNANIELTREDRNLIDTFLSAITCAAFTERPVYVQQTNVISKFDNVIEIDFANKMI